MIRGSEDIDVYVITGEAEATAASGRRRAPPSRSRSHASDYAWGALGVVLATVVALLARPVFEPGFLVMAFLLNVVLVAVRLGRGPSILASVLGVAAFDFFAVPPYYTFAVSDTEYFISFLAMLVVVLVISTLTARLRDQAVTFRRREHLAAVLYEMSRDLVRTTNPKEALQTGLQHLGQTFGAEVAAYLPDPFGRLRTAGAGADPGAQDAGVAQWVFDHGQPAGAGTSTFPSGAWLHVPLPSARGAAGVLSLRVGGEARFRDPEQLHLLETFASQIAAAFERTRLSEEGPPHPAGGGDGPHEGRVHSRRLARTAHTPRRSCREPPPAGGARHRPTQLRRSGALGRGRAQCRAPHPPRGFLAGPLPPGERRRGNGPPAH